MIEMEEIKGLAGMEKSLRQLPEVMARGIVRGALAAGAEFLRGKVAAAIAANFHSRSGDMLRNIHVQTSIEPGRRGGSIVRAKVFTLPFASKAPYSFFWEKGFQHIGRSRKLSRVLRHQARAAKRAGQDVREAKRGTGMFLRREVWRPAFEQSAHAALAMITARLRAGFDAAVTQVRSSGFGKAA